MPTDDIRPIPDVRPTPDPTILTTEQLMRVVGYERDYTIGQIGILRERLNAMDQAAKVLNETLHEVPTDLQQAIGRLQDLFGEKFSSVATQFHERDTRSERESRDNKVAVDAAFAAQKEAASEQNKSNTLAISKSEAATQETIAKLAELFATTTRGIADKVDDVKTRVQSIESSARGAHGQADTNRMAINMMIGVLMLLVVMAGVITAIIVATHK